MAIALRHVVVIVNPAAGGDPLGTAAAVERRCADASVAVEVRRTDFPGHAEQIAAGEAGRDGLVIAVGGDGTAGAVASGLYQAHADRTRAVPALLAAPAGTGNSSYLGIWGDRPWLDVLDLVLAGSAAVHWLDLAVIVESRRIVLLGAGSGLLAEALVTARTLGATPRHLRYGHALAATMADFEGYRGRVLVDGVEVAAGPTLMVAIGGGRYRGGGYLLLPRSRLDDGLLDVCVCIGERVPPEMAVLAATGAHLHRPDVRYARGREVVVERTDGVPLVFEHDGDVDCDGGARRTIRVLPGAVPVVVPLTVAVARPVPAAVPT